MKLGLRLKRLGKNDQALLIKVLTMSVSALLDEWFESTEIKAMLAASGTIGIFGSPSTPGTAFVLLHHLLGEAGGEPGAWGFVRGGMGGVTQALASSARSEGAELGTDGIGKATGVESAGDGDSSAK